MKRMPTKEEIEIFNQVLVHILPRLNIPGLKVRIVYDESPPDLMISGELQHIKYKPRTIIFSKYPHPEVVYEFVRMNLLIYLSCIGISEAGFMSRNGCFVLHLEVEKDNQIF